MITETSKILSGRIKAAKGKKELTGLEIKITLHYENGTITASELAKLDEMIMIRLAKLDTT